jgi:hypothetical protein
MSTVVGTSFFQVVLHDGTVINGGTAQDTAIVRAKTKRLHFGAPEFVKFIDGIKLDITEAGQFENAFFRIYASDGVDEDRYPESLAFELDLTQLQEFNPVRCQDARYYSLEIEDKQVRATWALSAIELFGAQVADSF